MSKRIGNVFARASTSRAIGSHSRRETISTPHRIANQSASINEIRIMSFVADTSTQTTTNNDNADELGDKIAAHNSDNSGSATSQLNESSESDHSDESNFGEVDRMPPVYSFSQSPYMAACIELKSRPTQLKVMKAWTREINDYFQRYPDVCNEIIDAFVQFANVWRDGQQRGEQLVSDYNRNDLVATSEKLAFSDLKHVEEVSKQRLLNKFQTLYENLLLCRVALSRTGATVSVDTYRSKERTYAPLCVLHTIVERCRNLVDQETSLVRAADCFVRGDFYTSLRKTPVTKLIEDFAKRLIGGGAKSQKAIPAIDALSVLLICATQSDAKGVQNALIIYCLAISGARAIEVLHSKIENLHCGDESNLESYPVLMVSNCKGVSLQSSAHYSIPFRTESSRRLLKKFLNVRSSGLLSTTLSGSVASGPLFSYGLNDANRATALFSAQLDRLVTEVGLSSNVVTPHSFRVGRVLQNAYGAQSFDVFYEAFLNGSLHELPNALKQSDVALAALQRWRSISMVIYYLCSLGADIYMRFAQRRGVEAYLSRVTCEQFYQTFSFGCPFARRLQTAQLNSSSEVCYGEALTMLRIGMLVIFVDKLSTLSGEKSRRESLEEVKTNRLYRLLIDNDNDDASKLAALRAESGSINVLWGEVTEIAGRKSKFLKELGDLPALSRLIHMELPHLVRSFVSGGLIGIDVDQSNIRVGTLVNNMSTSLTLLLRGQLSIRIEPITFGDVYMFLLPLSSTTKKWEQRGVSVANRRPAVDLSASSAPLLASIVNVIKKRKQAKSRVTKVFVIECGVDFGDDKHLNTLRTLYGRYVAISAGRSALKQGLSQATFKQRLLNVPSSLEALGSGRCIGVDITFFDKLPRESFLSALIPVPASVIANCVNVLAEMRASLAVLKNGVGPHRAAQRWIGKKIFNDVKKDDEANCFMKRFPDFFNKSIGSVSTKSMSTDVGSDVTASANARLEHVKALHMSVQRRLEANKNQSAAMVREELNDVEEALNGADAGLDLLFEARMEKQINTLNDDEQDDYLDEFLVQNDAARPIEGSRREVDVFNREVRSLTQLKECMAEFVIVQQQVSRNEQWKNVCDYVTNSFIVCKDESKRRRLVHVGSALSNYDEDDMSDDETSDSESIVRSPRTFRQRSVGVVQKLKTRDEEVKQMISDDCSSSDEYELDFSSASDTDSSVFKPVKAVNTKSDAFSVANKDEAAGIEVELVDIEEVIESDEHATVAAEQVDFSFGGGFESDQNIGGGFESDQNIDENMSDGAASGETTITESREDEPQMKRARFVRDDCVGVAPKKRVTDKTAKIEFFKKGLEFIENENETRSAIAVRPSTDWVKLAIEHSKLAKLLNDEESMTFAKAILEHGIDHVWAHDISAVYGFGVYKPHLLGYRACLRHIKSACIGKSGGQRLKETIEEVDYILEVAKNRVKLK